MENLLSGLLGALIGSGLGILGTGFIQWNHYKKQTLIQYKIEIGKQVIDLAIELIESISRIYVSHEKLTQLPASKRLDHAVNETYSYRERTLSILVEMISLQTCYSPVIHISRKDIDKFFDFLEEYFIIISKYDNLSDEYELNKQYTLLYAIKNEVLLFIYSIQDSMYKELIPLKDLRVMQNGGN